MSIQPRLQTDLLAHKECAKIMGNKFIGTFYICTKTSQSNYAICDYCMTNCHEKHDCYNSLPYGKYECYCANDHHQTNFDIDSSTTNNCLYQELYKETFNDGFYKFEENVYCGMCLTICQQLEINDSEKVTDKQDQKCSCNQHGGTNPILAFGDILNSFQMSTDESLYSIRNHFYHFDFNIFVKNEKTNGHIIQKFHNYLSTKEQHLKILQDLTFQSILDYINKTSLLLDSKGFFYDNMNIDIFDDSMKFINEAVPSSEPFSDSGDYLKYSPNYKHLKTQFNLLYLLFSIYVKGSYIKTHNLWSTEAIYQMNVYQRLKYIQNIDFFQERAFLSQDNKYFDKEKRNYKIIDCILKQYEDFICQCKNSEMFSVEFIFDIYPIFLSMMKFVFKYNIMEDPITTWIKYFDLVNETNIIKDKYKEMIDINIDCMPYLYFLNYKTTEESFEKSIFYFLLYDNDCYVMNSMLAKQESNTLTSTMIYTKNYDNINKIKKLISRIYFEKLIKPDTEKSKISSLSQYIFQSLTEKKSLVQYSLDDKNNSSIITQRPYNLIIKEISKKLRNDSRDFMTYKITLENYIELIEQSLLKFNDFIQDKQDFILDLNADYPSMLNIYKEEKTKIALEGFQYDIKNSMLFQALYEVIGNLTLGDKLKYNQQFSLISNKVRKFILQLYYLIMINNPESICQVINQDKQSFTSFFNHINEDFFIFYQRVIEILSLVNYEFSDINSLIQPLFMIKGITNENYIESPQLFFQCTNILFKMFNIIFKTLSYKYYYHMAEISAEFFNKIDSIHHILKESINTYLEGNMIIVNENKVTHKTVSNCISNYFQVVAHFESIEISKYVTYHNKVTSSIYNEETIPVLFKKYIQTPSNERTIDINVIFQMLKFYLLKSSPFKFNIANVDQLLLNMLSEFTVEDDQKKISNLSFINIWKSEKVTNKQSDQIDTQLQELFEKYDFISMIAMNFEELFKEAFKARDSFESMEEIKVVLYCFIQDVLLKSSYQLIKSLEIYLPYVKGIMFEHVRQMIFYLLKAFEFFYLNITVLTKEEINYISEEVRAVNIFEIEVQKELTQEQLELIHKSIEENAAMKYFQFNAYIKNYNEIIAMIYDRNTQKRSFDVSQQYYNSDNFELSWDLNYNYASALFFPSQYSSDQTGLKCIENFNSVLTIIINISSSEERQTISEKIEKIMTDSKIMYYLKHMFFYCLNEMISRINLITNEDNISTSYNALNNTNHFTRIISLLIIFFDYEKIKDRFFKFIYKYDQQDNENNKKTTEKLPPEQNEDQNNENNENTNDKIPLEQDENQDNENNDKISGVLPLEQDEDQDILDNNNSNDDGKSLKVITTKLTVTKDEKRENCIRSFFNILSSMMRMILNNCLESNQYNLTKNIFTEMTIDYVYQINFYYERYSTLMIKMIQDYPLDYEIFFRTEYKDQEIPKAFYYLCKDMSQLIINKSAYFDISLVSLQKSHMSIIIAIINDANDCKNITQFISFFNIEQLSETLLTYMKYLYLQYVKNIALPEETMEFSQNNIIYDDKILKEFKKAYKINHQIATDQFFQLAQQIYLLLLFFDEKCNNISSKNIIKCGSYSFSDYIKYNNNNLPDISLMTSKDMAILGQIFFCKFFIKTEKKIEIVINKNDQKQTKTIYFSNNPIFYGIPTKYIDELQQNADRSSRTSKIQFMLENVSKFWDIIYYKYYITSQKGLPDLFSNMEKDFSSVTSYNFLICCIINLTFINIGLNNEYSSKVLFYIALIIKSLQVLYNGFALYQYFSHKYSLDQYIYSRNTIFKKFNLSSYILCIKNNHIIIALLIIPLGLLGIFTSYDLLFYTLQLIILSTTIDTIQDIITAFKSRFTQFFSLICFIAIIIFNYAVFDYYFLKEDYLISPDETADPIDRCSNILECFLTMFNNGVRSGGGIGDIINESSYSTGGYYLRWGHDMIFYITVILFLLNMINGMIVSTFGQLREEKGKQEDDMENKCYICSIEKCELEKNKNSMANHLKNEHNLKVYIRYIMSLMAKETIMLSKDEHHIEKCIKKKDYEFLPLYEATD